MQKPGKANQATSLYKVHSTPLSGPFHCIGMDYMEMGRVVNAIILTKWPDVYGAADHKATVVAKWRSFRGMGCHDGL